MIRRISIDKSNECSEESISHAEDRALLGDLLKLCDSTWPGFSSGNRKVGREALT